MTTNPLNIEIPKSMRTLERDKRGLPIPFIVMRDNDGNAHFTINDQSKVNECITKKLCAITGKRLTDGGWFVGGPKSFFHPNGAFIDPPMNEEAARFAVRVCPYLAAPSYARRIDERTVKPGQLSDDTVILRDSAVIDERPTAFVLGLARSYTMVSNGMGQFYFKPTSIIRTEFWRHGKELPYLDVAGEIQGIIRDAMKD